MFHVVGNCIEEVEHDALLTVHFGILHPNKPDQALLDLSISSTFVCVCFDFFKLCILEFGTPKCSTKHGVFLLSTLHLTIHYTFGTLERQEHIGIDIVSEPEFRGQLAC